MKTKPGHISLLLAFVAGGLSAQTTFVSNMNNGAGGGIYVFDNQWVAREFTTGANAGGYQLNHVDLALNRFSSDPTFAVSLWSDASNAPGSQLGVFTYAGSGTQFNWVSGANLNAATTYWITVSSTQSFDGSTSHAWGATPDASFALAGGWTAGAALGSADQGGGWGNLPSNFQFAVTATELTAIPEPSTYAALAGLAAMVGAVVARRRRA